MVDGLHQAFRVEEVIGEGDAGVTLILDGSLPAVEPGQFVMVWLPGIDERPFSVMDDDPLSLAVADIGPFTHALCALRPGDRVWIRGPFGHGFSLSGERHLLVGGGSGAASLTLLAKRVQGEGQQAIVGLGARSGEQLMLAWRFEELGHQVLIATDDGSQGYHGTVLDAIDDLLVRGWPDAVYACGPEPMLVGLAQRTKMLGLPCWVSLERVMKCGIGICGNCHCGDQLVCKDGPVFTAEMLLACAVQGSRILG